MRASRYSEPSPQASRYSEPSPQASRVARWTKSITDVLTVLLLVIAAKTAIA
jgi:hypothetical protein